MPTEYEPVIGLEVHCELKTATKLFCGCSTVFGKEANTQVCPVCLGLPGTLAGHEREGGGIRGQDRPALNCTISKYSKMDRKNYYYPDLPKAYQISQYDKPLNYRRIPGNHDQETEPKGSASPGPTWKRTRASWCTRAARRAGWIPRITPWPTTTAAAFRWWRSFPNPICAARRRPTPT